MNNVAICQSNYIPWRGYFDLIASADVFVIYDEVQYTKNDWRNRNLIKTATGLSWLTVPVRRESIHQKINETLTMSTGWERKHITALTLNYSKSPFFQTYKDEIFKIYENFTSLSNLNVNMIKKICEILMIDTKIIDSSDLCLSGDRNSKLIDACIKLSATTYISGPSASCYLDTAAFNLNNINVNWIDYSGYLEYPQRFGTFIGNVSILDLIFNVGPNSKNYLKYTTP
jgi:hypothetical protein